VVHGVGRGAEQRPADRVLGQQLRAEQLLLREAGWPNADPVIALCPELTARVVVDLVERERLAFPVAIHQIDMQQPVAVQVAGGARDRPGGGHPQVEGRPVLTRLQVDAVENAQLRDHPHVPQPAASHRADPRPPPG